MTRCARPSSRNPMIRLLDENRAALKALREAGITEIHDIATPDQTKRFIELEDNGELTCRVWLRPDLSRGAELKARRIHDGASSQNESRKAPGFGTARLKDISTASWGRTAPCSSSLTPTSREISAIGGPIPPTTRSSRSATWRRCIRLIKIGLDAGFVPNVHAIGDRGVAEDARPL